MIVTYAQFNINHRGKNYACQITVQGTYKNSRQVSATVVDANNKTLLVTSMAGRQIISGWTAKSTVRKALLENGIIKPPSNRMTEGKTVLPSYNHKKV